ncbi:MAG: HU family DNA-binding protein [Bacteroidales bacterium]|nr:HU family DNA-binding protein [Bacteroidales bacterium]
MTKKELVKKVSAQTGVDRALVQRVTEAAMAAVRESIQEGEAVSLRGFGTFERKHRASKAARDMKAGRMMMVAAHDVPHFRPCREFKDSLL